MYLALLIVKFVNLSSRGECTWESNKERKREATDLLFLYLFESNKFLSIFLALASP